VKWLLIAAAIALVAACTPAPRELTPRELLDKAADAADQVNTAHFSLEQQNGSVVVASGVQVTNAEGDVQRPDRLQMKFTLRLGTLSAESQLIAVGSELFLTNPLTGQWQPAPPAATAPRVLDKDGGVGSLLRKVTDPQKIAIETLDGAQTQHLKGDVPGSAFTAMTGAPATVNSVAGEIWVGTDDVLPHQVRLTGPVTTADTPATVRILKLSKFNQPVSIEPPR
jgi:hypothetical protein